VLNFGIKDAKEFFFDKEKVLSALKRGTAQALSRIGAYVRATAQNSLSDDTKPSKPGHAPKSHTGYLRHFLFFVFDESRKSVVIGPALLNQQNPDPKPVDQTVPGILEFGGQAIKTVRYKSGHKVDCPVSIAARPYMGPAMERTLERFASAWQYTFRG
jgi:hypothetical protein